MKIKLIIVFLIVLLIVACIPNKDLKMDIAIEDEIRDTEDKIEKIDDANYTVYVMAPPIDGKANAAIVKLLADHFDISQSLVEIISGHMARTKVVEINN